jgi:hypothetical protein
LQATVATYTFVNPIITVLLGWLVLGEQPSGWMIAGAAMVIASVAGVLVSNPDAKKKWLDERLAEVPMKVMSNITFIYLFYSAGPTLTKASRAINYGTTAARLRGRFRAAPDQPSASA